MTVSYQYDVASTSSGGFIRLLFRWKGSVWKLVYTELALLVILYTSLSLLYRFAMTGGQRRVFELIVHYCSSFMEMIPLSFLLGFYVTFTANRWWNQYMAIPWPDRVMNVICMYVPGTDDQSRMLRRTLMRYLNLTLILVLRSISKAVKRRFPSKEHLVEAGFMTKLEMEIWSAIPQTEFNTFWIPCTWFINVLREAKQECRITDSFGLKLIMEEFNDFRAKCGLLWSYDWISVPLVYTQVVTIATYAFFCAALFGRQYIQSEDPRLMDRHPFDFYVPIFTVVQYFLYMGLLKVAEQLINPFGDDDEDFELNWIIDRHIKVSYLGADTLNGPPPPLVKDPYYYQMDYKLPYTAASVAYKKKTYRGSVAYMHVPQEQQSMVVPDISEEEETETSSENGKGDQRSSMWTLLGNRRSSGQAAKGESESDPNWDDSTLQIYFRTPPCSLQGSDLNINKVGEMPRTTNAQERMDLGAQPHIQHKGSYLKDLFKGKQKMKLLQWRGAMANYEGPSKQRLKTSRSKVTFRDNGSGQSTISRRLSAPLLHKREGSRSTPDLTKLQQYRQKLIDRLQKMGIGDKPPQKKLSVESLFEICSAGDNARDAWIQHHSMPNLSSKEHDKMDKWFPSLQGKPQEIVPEIKVPSAIVQPVEKVIPSQKAVPKSAQVDKTDPWAHPKPVKKDSVVIQIEPPTVEPKPVLKTVPSKGSLKSVGRQASLTKTEPPPVPKRVLKSVMTKQPSIEVSTPESEAEVTLPRRRFSRPEIPKLKVPEPSKTPLLKDVGKRVSFGQSSGSEGLPESEFVVVINPKDDEKKELIIIPKKRERSASLESSQRDQKISDFSRRVSTSLDSITDIPTLTIAPSTSTSESISIDIPESTSADELREEEKAKECSSSGSDVVIDIPSVEPRASTSASKGPIEISYLDQLEHQKSRKEKRKPALFKPPPLPMFTGMPKLRHIEPPDPEHKPELPPVTRELPELPPDTVVLKPSMLKKLARDQKGKS